MFTESSLRLKFGIGCFCHCCLLRLWFSFGAFISTVKQMGRKEKIISGFLFEGKRKRSKSFRVRRELLGRFLIREHKYWLKLHQYLTLITKNSEVPSGASLRNWINLSTNRSQMTSIPKHRNSRKWVFELLGITTVNDFSKCHLEVVHAICRPESNASRNSLTMSIVSGRKVQMALTPLDSSPRRPSLNSTATTDQMNYFLTICEHRARSQSDAIN